MAWTGGYAPRFLAFFVAWSFFRFDSESRPTHLPLTQAVSWPGVLKVVFSLIHSLGRSFDNLGVFMPIKTDGLVHLFIVAATIIASVGLFAISLFYPAFNLSDGSSYGGLVTLLIGWMGLLGVGDEHR